MHNPKFLLLVTGLFLFASVGIMVFLVGRGVGKEQNATPSQATESDPTKCQGNPNALAKCFDCKKDSGVSSQVNILDFQCFTKYYGQNVGK